MPLKNYTKWNKLLKMVIDKLYNKIKKFGMCVCKCYEYIGPCVEGDGLANVTCCTTCMFVEQGHPSHRATMKL